MEEREEELKGSEDPDAQCKTVTSRHNSYLHPLEFMTSSSIIILDTHTDTPLLSPLSVACMYVFTIDLSKDWISN